MNENWNTINKEVEAAFEDLSALNTDRKTLERRMVGLSLDSPSHSKDHEVLNRKHNAIKHLLSARLAEETFKHNKLMIGVAILALTASIVFNVR